MNENDPQERFGFQELIAAIPDVLGSLSGWATIAGVFLLCRGCTTGTPEGAWPPWAVTLTGIGLLILASLWRIEWRGRK